MALRIGVLALQGAYAAHERMLTSLGAAVRLVRRPAELDGLDGLVIPGGESTTMLKFLERDGFLAKLGEFAAGAPVFGTCAGTILLAKEVAGQASLGALDVAVERNAYGRQNDSAILSAESALGGDALEMVFIRAPRMTRVGAGVEVLARRGDDAVLVREGHVLAATFHPELSGDTRVHQLFLEMVRQGVADA